jgi:hypothetical protein
MKLTFLMLRVQLKKTTSPSVAVQKNSCHQNNVDGQFELRSLCSNQKVLVDILRENPILMCMPTINIWPPHKKHSSTPIVFIYYFELRNFWDTMRSSIKIDRSCLLILSRH